MNIPVHLIFPILELSKILMSDFWYDYIEAKYGEKARSCYFNTDNSIVYIKTDDIYKNIAEDVETRFDTSNYELNRPFPTEKIKKVIRLMKDESGGKVKVKFVGLKAKTYSYLIDDSSEDKKAENTKKCDNKRKLKFKNYKNCLEATQLENKINHLNKINLTYIVLKT